MKRVIIIVEGQTEEQFVNELLGPALHPKSIYVSACILGNPGHKGGHVSYDRLKSDVLKLLKQERGTFCTTLIDLYGLGKGFPESKIPAQSSAHSNVAAIEDAIQEDIIKSVDDMYRSGIRFRPYIQLHEFEGLLFSDPTAFAQGIYADELSEKLEAIRRQFATPEDINDSPETAPSKRILKCVPNYNKPLWGLHAALSVGLPAMRRECPRFNEWVNWLETL